MVTISLYLLLAAALAAGLAALWTELLSPPLTRGPLLLLLIKVTQVRHLVVLLAQVLHQTVEVGERRNNLIVLEVVDGGLWSTERFFFQPRHGFLAKLIETPSGALAVLLSVLADVLRRGFIFVVTQLALPDLEVEAEAAASSVEAVEGGLGVFLAGHTASRVGVPGQRVLIVLARNIIK